MSFFNIVLTVIIVGLPFLFIWLGLKAFSKKQSKK